MLFQNWHKEFDEFWLDHLKISKIHTLMRCFWLTYIMFELKKYRGVIFHDTRKWCKIWRKTDLWFGKLHEEFGPFIQSGKFMSIKFIGQLCFMTMKNAAKFEEELTFQFKIDMRNLTNFHPSTQKFHKFGL